MRGKVQRTYGAKGKANNARISENRFMWLRTMFGQFAAFRYDSSTVVNEDGELEEVDNELGPAYVLILPKRGVGRPIQFNITSLTLEELEATRQFFNTVFDLAEPVVKHRDKVAQHAADQGDDSFSRIYRQVPQFIRREGTIREDDERLLKRSWDSFVGAGDGSSPNGGIRGDGDELASGESQKDRPQDHGSETD